LGRKKVVDNYQAKRERAAELKNEDCRLKICGAVCGGEAGGFKNGCFWRKI